MVENTFRAIVLGVAALFVSLVAFWRFSRDVTAPPLPPKPEPTQVTDRNKLVQVNASAVAWQSYIEKDSKDADLGTTTVAEMSRQFAYAGDSKRESLEPGQVTEKAGLRLEAGTTTSRGETILTLKITNAHSATVAYRVVTRTSMGANLCSNRTILQYDAVLIPAGQSVVRSECAYRPGMALIVEAAETVEVSGLAAVYLAKVPPLALGIDPRVADGHQAELLVRLPNGRPCSLVLSAARRSALESGEIAWRDVVDFYARHRCETYNFPDKYQYFKKDSERPLPATAAPAR